MKFSLVIPAYNEEKTLEKVIKTALKVKEVNQVIVVNDGSEDNTKKIALKFKDKIDLISYKKNKGKGFALWSGLKKAKNEAIVFLDADFTNLKPNHIQKLITTFSNNRVDLITGIAPIQVKKPIKTRLGFLKFFQWVEKNYIYSLSGQRVGWKRDFSKIPNLKTSKYGVDLLITDWFLSHGKIVKKVFLKDVKHLSKKQKWGNKGFIKQAQMLKEIFHSFKYLKSKSKLALEGVKPQNKKWKKFIDLPW